MRNLKSYLLILLITLSGNIFSQEDKDKTKEDKLSFTKEEFKKAVMSELDKKMRLLGKGDMVSFSKSLLSKEEKLRDREADLSKREEQLKINEQQFLKRVQEFKTEQGKFITCLDGVDKKASDRITKMVSVVSGMRPQQAANLLSEQESEISVRIISELDPAKTSKIFNLMDKEISARLQKQYLKMKK